MSPSRDYDYRVKVVDDEGQADWQVFAVDGIHGLSPAVGDVLEWDGTAWVNTPSGGLVVPAYLRKDQNLADVPSPVAARTNLGLGTAATHSAADFDGAGAAAAAQAAAIAASQPLDSDLTAIAALTTTSYGRAFLALADAAAGRTALGLGTAATHATGDYEVAGAAAAAQAAAIAASQPLDSDLTAIAALTTTTFGRSLLAMADGATVATALGLQASVRAPSGVLGETVRRGDMTGTANVQAITAGYIYMVELNLPAGLVIGHLSWWAGAQAAVNPSHWWYGLYNSAGVQLATTADQLTAAFAANVDHPLAVATVASGAASSFTTTYAGLHYLGICFVTAAGTQPNLLALGTGATTAQLNLNKAAPAFCGFDTSGTGAGSLTGPPAFPYTSGLPNANGANIAYGYVGT